MAAATVRVATAEDWAWIEPVLQASWGGTRIAVHGALVDVRDHAILVASEHSGLLVHRELDRQTGEILLLEAFRKGRGVGRALLETYLDLARAQERARVQVTTTNDNLRAIKFYQLNGFRLRKVDSGAVDLARRTLKPQIPVLGMDGIPIRDEIMLQVDLRSTASLG